VAGDHFPITGIDELQPEKGNPTKAMGDKKKSEHQFCAQKKKILRGKQDKHRAVY